MDKEKKEELKKAVAKLLKKKGNTRGEAYLIRKFIQKKHGEEGVKQVEKEISSILRRPYKFPLRPTRDWYSEGEEISVILITKYFFGWSRKDIFELGRFDAIHSFAMRVLLRYFISVGRIFRDAPRYWDKHFDFSKLKAVQLDEKKRYAILRIEGYKLHPVMYDFYCGYFYALTASCVASQKVSVRATKKVFDGDQYDEYLIKW